MTDMNLNELTVIELRKVAKEMKVPLGAGISKQGIIDKLSMAMAEANRAAPWRKFCFFPVSDIGNLLLWGRLQSCCKGDLWSPRSLKIYRQDSLMPF